MEQEPVWRRYARMLGVNPRADTEDELAFHYEMRVRDYVRRGLSEEAARAAARQRLGDLERARQECAVEDDLFLRERQRREWFSALRQDVKYGLRMLLHAPVFTTVAVLTLALGIGGTTAIFSVVHRVLLAPLPYPQPDRLVHLWERSPQDNDHNVVSSGSYLDWARLARSFDALGAVQGPFGIALTGDGEPAQLMSARLTPSALRALGSAPLLGRTFNAEDAAGAGDVVVLSHKLWQQRFGGETAVIGRRITLNDVPHTVIGVMPAHFEFPDAATELWQPLTTQQLNPNERRSHNYAVVGRLRAGVTVGHASAEMAGIARALATEHPQFLGGWGVNVVPMQADLTTDVKPMLLILLGTVAVVLLIACGNLANLLLARAVGREQEMALRGALGAGRARITRQLLTESLLIAVGGGVLGVALARFLLRALIAAAPDNIPLLQQVSLNWFVLAFAGAVTLLSTILFGLVPALRLARADMHTALRSKRAAGSLRDTRLRATLLVGEVALSVVLLVGAGLLVRSFQALQRTDLGYRSDDLLLMSVSLPHARYDENQEHIEFYRRTIERVRAVPGVSLAAGTSHRPARGDFMTFSFVIDGRQASNASGREDPEELHVVTPDYFRTLGIQLVEGRYLEERDRTDAPHVVVINRALARKHWPNESPLGKRINFRPEEQPWMEIVGVVADTRMESPDQAAVPAMYKPFAQKIWPWMSWLSIVARVPPGSTAAEFRPAFQTALWEIDSQLPLQDFTLVNDMYGASLARRTFAMTLIITFALVALALSIIGLYGLMAFTVEQQRREIGVRMALGARPGVVLWGVLGHALRLAAIGLAFGLLASVGATRLLENLLYDVRPTDPATIAAITILVATTALAASWLPAYRAVRASPALALRGG
jgi:putative ABC transport system permease protein